MPYENDFLLTNAKKTLIHVRVYFSYVTFIFDPIILTFLYITILLKYINKSLSSCQVFSQHMLIKQLE